MSELHVSKDFDIPSVAFTSQEGQENRKLKVTLLSSEWRSSTDGDLSTINRELAIQLAKHSNVEVSVFLLQCSEEDKSNAASHHVQIVEAEKVIGWNPVDCLINVPEGHVMDCVVGHGVTLGKQVQVIRKHHQCKWIQVVHTAPEELGMYKSISQGEQLQKAEVALCEKADQVVAIGPKLADTYKRYLRCSRKEQNVFDVTPGIFSEFLDVEQAIEERRTFSVLVIGSVDSSEDFILKGYDLAAQAIAELKDKSYQLKFVGAPRGKGDEIAQKLLQHGIDHNQLTVRSFSDKREVLANLFCEVDLVIMPSKTEGFGVNALEALSAGLPVLVSGSSGFGEALREMPLGPQCVIDSEDPKVWAREIKAVRRKKRSVRLEETLFLRKRYLEMYSWEKPIRSLVERMYSLVFGSENRPHIATGVKRPASSDFLDHHSKRFERKQIKYDHLEGSSGGYSSHLPTEYGQFSLPSASVTQGKPVHERSHAQDYPEQLVELIRREYRGAVLCPFPWCEDELQFELSKIFTRLMIVARNKERAKLSENLVRMTDVFEPLKKCDCTSQCKCKREKPIVNSIEGPLGMDEIVYRRKLAYDRLVGKNVTERFFLEEAMPLWPTKCDCTSQCKCKREKPRVVLIEGPPGIGKTTYCQKLAYDWSIGDITTESSFPKVDMLLRLTCREMETSNIEDAIEDQLLPINVDKKDKDSFFQFIRHNQSRILLMLDGLDELPKNLFDEFLPLIRGRVYPLTYVVLTARHEVGMKVRRHCDALFEIVGYTEDDADSYIEKYFSKHENPSLAWALIEEISKEPQLRELTANALNTALLCLVFEDLGGVLPYNRSMLYFELVNCVLRRYCSNKGISLDDKDPVEKYTDQLNQLGELALKALLKDQLAFTLVELKNQSIEFLQLGFLSREASASKIKPKPTYSFIHKTFQEYFAAFHIAHELLTTDWDRAALLAQLSPVDKYWQVWEFLISMAARKNDDTAILLVSSLWASFQHQKQYPKQPASKSKDSQDFFFNESYMEPSLCRLKPLELGSTLTRGDVFEANIHDWLLVMHSPVDEEISLLEKIVDIIDKCEHPDSKLKPYQIKMAGKLAHCFPLDKIGVTKGCICINLDSRFQFVVSEYLKSNYKLNELVWGLDVSAAAALVDVLRTSNTLTHLHLTNGSCITSLTPALQANRTLTHLSMRKTKVGDRETKELAKVLRLNHTLTHLCLADNKITHIGVEALAEALRSNKALENLDIGYNCIGDGGAVALSQALGSNRPVHSKELAKVLQLNHTLTHLCLADNKITHIGVEALAEALRSNKALENLDIGYNCIGDGGAVALSQALGSNRPVHSKELAKVLQLNHTLTHLCLANNKITPIGVEALAEALRSNKALENLDIGYNCIGDGGAVALSQALESNRTLRSLNVGGGLPLKYIALGDRGIRAVAHALRCNNSLTYLDVSGHCGGGSAVLALGEALQSNCSLTHLYLRGENASTTRLHFGNSAAGAFSKALQSRDTQLTYLDLQFTSFSTSCVITLAEGLRVNGTLTHLCLRSNNIDCPGAVALAQALKTNQTLTHLELGDNKISDAGVKEFVKVLQWNETLMFLGLDYNRKIESGIDLCKVLGGRWKSEPRYPGGVVWIRN
ncbi:NLR family CARD domain-containing protein 3-like isoform X1 [Stylophora pistillata]|uniref:NLR family CARD domain-containing protein 3-like isoform X1 n=1 Tax=Stylophora pistillata TaxID=50429 RepID=UPI000C053A0B|nr:NLR family CARD domain-containing protein 3-like isoform X1 [Stylophora pistillata]